MLAGYVEILNGWHSAMAKDITQDISDRADIVDEHWSKLAKASYKVIEKAAKIKTKDLG